MHTFTSRLAILIGVAGLANFAQGAAEFTSLLPRDVVPLHYDLTLRPDAAALRFTGRVEIAIEVEKPARKITLNSLDLDLRSARVDSQPAKIRIDHGAQTATFMLARPLKRGTHRLTIEYTGPILTQPSGLFALDYTQAGAARRALYTQFEPTDARRMFPGWDEPAYKATFSLELDVRESDGMAISNMPVASREPRSGGRVRVRFEQTPRMSIYLLFFALGDFERTVVQAAGTQIGIVTRRGDASKGQFALSAATDVLSWYNDYFGVKYPLPKLDLIAAPGQSQFFGAMENWGAIFYFDRVLLLDPSFSSADDRRRVFEVVAHEVAHQWFGDLVTMGWWDDLWLNEGFASWMADRVTAQLHPEWNQALAEVDSRESAIRLDALASTHPVVQHILSPDELNQAFDSITYSKGSAVLRMLESFVGADAWREGVRRYIAAHALGNTRNDDLWTAVESAAGKPVSRIAHDFTLQPGVPLIRVEQVRCEQGHSVAELSQGEFQADRIVDKPRSWQVPVILGTKAQSMTVLVMGRGVASVSGCEPVVVNRGQAGYFRTLYAPAVFDVLARYYADLDAVDQLGLLSDAWALGLTGQQPAADALNLIRGMSLDAAPELWQRAAGIIDFIGNLCGENIRTRAVVARFAGARLGAKLAQLGWSGPQGEPDNVSSLRNTLLEVLGDLGDPQVVAEARTRFTNEDKVPIPAAQRQAILGVVAVNADPATWEKMHAMARAETEPLVRRQRYQWLGEVNEPVLAQRALDLALSGEPSQTDAAGMISAVAYRHPRLAFEFAAAHATAVRSRVDASMRDSYIVGLARRAGDAAIIPLLEQWAKANMPDTARRALDTAVAEISHRAGLRLKRLPDIIAWLEQHD